MPVSKQARLAVRDPDTGTALPHGAACALSLFEACSAFTRVAADAHSRCHQFVTR